MADDIQRRIEPRSRLDLEQVDRAVRDPLTAAVEPRGDEALGEDLGAEAVFLFFGTSANKKPEFYRQAKWIYQWAIAQPDVKSHQDAMLKVHSANLKLRSPDFGKPPIQHFYLWAIFDMESRKYMEAKEGLERGKP